MLHRCSDCRQLYLTSSHNHLCDICGSQRQQQIERLLEVDDAVEWWRICARAMFNDYGNYRTTRRMATTTVVSGN